jgi:hypothetical protein
MANEKKAPKNNEISAEQIAEWKKTKSNVKEISIQVDEEDMSDNAEVAKFMPSTSCSSPTACWAVTWNICLKMATWASTLLYWKRWES